MIIETKNIQRRRRRRRAAINGNVRRLPPPLAVVLPLLLVVVAILTLTVSLTLTSSGSVTDAFVFPSTISPATNNMRRRSRKRTTTTSTNWVVVNDGRKKTPCSSSSSLASAAASAAASQQFQGQKENEGKEEEVSIDNSLSSSSSSSSSRLLPLEASMSIDDAVMARYACTRYERYVGNGTNDTNSSIAGWSDQQEETTETETGPAASIITAATSGDPVVIETARSCLELARRSPSGFNVQPYKLLFLTSSKTKLALSKYCCGHNAHRVRDSDCTVVFLADRQPTRSWMDYKKYIMTEERRTKKKMRTGSNCSSSSSSSGSTPASSNNDADDKDDDNDQNRLSNKNLVKNNNNNRLMTMLSSRISKLSTRFKKFKVFVFISIFTQGFPYLPTILSEPLSSIFCFLLRVCSWLTRSHYPIPTISNPIAWSQKNTMLVAMSYMLLCSSRNLTTTPMEGYTTWGIRKALKIPRRYTIPLIVTTGRPYIRNRTNQTTTTTNDDDGGNGGNGNDNNNDNDNKNNSIITDDQSKGSDGGGISGSSSGSGGGGGSDDAGMVHGNTKDTSTKRYPSEMIIYENVFGGQREGGGGEEDDTREQDSTPS